MSFTGNSAYLPDRSRFKEQALDEMIKEIAKQLVVRLDELQNEAEFAALANESEPDIRAEALNLQKEIACLKKRLSNI